MTAFPIGHSVAKFVTALSTVGFGSYLRDDDIIDRINHKVIYGILIALGVGSGAKQFVGEPIYCWLPVQYSSKKHFKQFANNYCWVESLYSVPWEDPVPTLLKDRYVSNVGFYRWATVMFVFLAFMYRVPNLIWQALKDHSGIKLSKICTMSLNTALMDQDARDKQLAQVAEFLHRWIKSHARVPGSSKMAQTVFHLRAFGKKSGRYLVSLYIVIKLMYLLNVIGQFYFISVFLRLNFWRFGIEALSSYAETGDWEDHFTFPRIGLCDMRLYNLINLNTLTIQCVLAMNLFLEKMFLFVWCFSVLMIVVNALSFLKWIWLLTSEKKSVDFLLEYSGFLSSPAAVRDGVKDREVQAMRSFARDYLRPDGLFVLRMVAANTSELLTYDLIQQVYRRYKKDTSLVNGDEEVDE